MVQRRPNGTGIRNCSVDRDVGPERTTKPAFFCCNGHIVIFIYAESLEERTSKNVIALRYLSHLWHKGRESALVHFLGDSPTLQPPDPPPAEIATARL
jgi:hypothetical protein